MENELPNNKEFLGRKKIRLDKLKQSQKESKKNEDEDSDEELNIFKKITSGKINVKNLLNKKYSDLNENEKFEKQELKDTDKKHLSHRLQEILPTPKKNLKDKLIFKSDENFFTQYGKYKNLVNPDSSQLMVFDSNNSTNIHNSSSNRLIDVNAQDQVDSNWSLKYISQLQKESTPEIDSLDNSKNPTQLSNLINNYNNSMDQHFNEVSKYSKPTAKQKYGW